MKIKKMERNTKNKTKNTVDPQLSCTHNGQAYHHDDSYSSVPDNGNY